ncbi:hypothetical protein SMICM304S_02321 [Streptomyces microflavus]
MQRGQFGARVDPQLPHQPGAQVLVRRECLALATRRVQDPHLGGAQALPQRAERDEVRELPGEERVVARLQARLRLLLQHGEPLLREALGGSAYEEAVREVRVRRSAPQPQGLREQRGPGARVPDGAGLGHQGTETYGVHLVAAAVEPQPVAGGLAHHPVPADDPAQLGDLGLEGARGLARRRVAPQVVDEAVGGDRPPVVREQIRQQGPDLGFGDSDFPSLAVPHHQWPEYPKPHSRHRTCPVDRRSGRQPPRRFPEGSPKYPAAESSPPVAPLHR